MDDKKIERYGININGGEWNAGCNADTPLTALRVAITETLPSAIRNGRNVSPWCKIEVKRGDLRTSDTVAMYLSAKSAESFLEAWGERIKDAPKGSAIIVTPYRRAFNEPVSTWIIERNLQALLDIAAREIDSGAEETKG